MKQKTYKTRTTIQREYIDEETGEEIAQRMIETEYVPGYNVMNLPQRKRIGNGDFITVFQNTMYRIATEANLTKGEYKLLLFLIGIAGFDNCINIDYPYLVKELGDKRQNIVKALQGLVARNIVIRRDGARGGATKAINMELRVNYDQLNYGITWKGDFGEHKKIKMNHPEIEPCPQNLSLPRGKETNLFELIEERKKEIIERLEYLKKRKKEWTVPLAFHESPFDEEIEGLQKELEKFSN